MNDTKTQDAQVRQIDVHAFKQRVDTDPKLCVIDVREQDEWDHAHLACATLIPKDSLLGKINEHVPNKNQAIYLHCQSGTRSTYAGEWLMDAGYKEVYSIAGGIKDWIAAGYEVIK